MGMYTCDQVYWADYFIPAIKLRILNKSDPNETIFAQNFFLYMNTSSLSCSSVLPTQATSGCVYITDGTQL
jgi:hypothetical protein